MESTDVAVIQQSSGIPDTLRPEDLQRQVKLIQQVMASVMRKDEHYGTIPGTPKPTLYKAGAEKLVLTFRLDPQYESTEIYDGDHLTVKSRCILYHIATGNRMGSGEGSCSTKESKYAYRKGERLCPVCGKDTIIKGKKEYGGGWLCFGKKGGCDAKFPDGDESIESQNVERMPNPDLPDMYNTVLKMANKRSLIAAVLNVTAASDIFTQDVEDMPQFNKGTDKPPADKPTPPQKKSAPQPGTGARPVTDPQRKMLFAKCSKAGIAIEDFCKEFEITSLNECEFDKVTAYLTAIDNWGKQPDETQDREPGQEG